jgi:putative inorganic carbon (HCO3(-)) transporter
VTWPRFVEVPPDATPRQAFLTKAAVWLTFGSAVSIVVSIWLSQMLLWFGTAALLFSGQPLKLPRIKLPLALFMLGTLISLAFSGEVVHGLPQIKKLFVFLMLLVAFSCLRSVVAIRSVFLVWALLGSIAAVLGIAQFVVKFQEARAAGVSFVPYYTTERITGFMSHWNTFSEEEMFVFLMLCAFLFFAPVPRRISIWLTCAGLLTIGIVLAETRGVWGATAVAILYLIWFWRPKLMLLLPVIAVLLWFTPVVGQRVRSILHPEQVDSNSFHTIVWRTGIAMIERHPLLGLGPDGPKFHFQEYIPRDIPRPLPEGFYQHAHNFYIQYAADRGIPTALMMLWLLIESMVDFWRGLRSQASGRSYRKFLLHGATAVILATLIDGVVEYNLGDSEFLMMFLVVIACGYLALEPGLLGPESLKDQPA